MSEKAWLTPLPISLAQVKKGEPTTLYSKGRILGYKRCVCSAAAAVPRLRWHA